MPLASILQETLLVPPEPNVAAPIPNVCGFREDGSDFQLFYMAILTDEIY